MTEQKINRMRKQFILASTLSFFIVMLAMGGLIYLFMSITTRNEVDQIISFIVKNDGDIDAESHDLNDASDDSDDDSSDLDVSWSLSHFFGTGNFISEEEDIGSRTRYFAVLFSEDGTVESVKSRHMASIDKDSAVQYAQLAMGRFFKLGSFGSYYYGVSDRPSGGIIVVYVDMTSRILAARRILYFTLILLGAGSLFAFMVMRSISYQMVKPEVENAERQKQFITNASHELKTPLAVIRANTEMQEMLEGETEWTQSTMRQVGRMEGLIGNLVMIARSQEQSDEENHIKLDISVPVSETAGSFIPVAESEGKRLTVTVEDDVFITGTDSAVRQLVSLLTDNAVKYCDPEGNVTVDLKKQGKSVILTTTNTYSSGSSVDTGKFFERFYREDVSHNEKGGYGIGLSVAESIVSSMGGSIEASWKEGIIIFTCRFKSHL